MGNDPKKPIEDLEDDEGSTAMFSREAHGWFSSMADARETDGDSVADLGRNAVIESSPLSRSGGSAVAPSAARGGAASINSATPVGRAPGAPSALPRAEHTPLPPTGARAALGHLSGKQVMVIAFVGGAVLAGILGAIAFFVLTAR